MDSTPNHIVYWFLFSVCVTVNVTVIGYVASSVTCRCRERRHGGMYSDSVCVHSLVSLKTCYQDWYVMKLKHLSVHIACNY